MLPNYQEPKFPRLIKTANEGILKFPGKPGENVVKPSHVPLYTLGWSDLDSIKRAKHEKAKKCCPQVGISWVDTLPEPWNQTVTSALFAINAGYRQEIERNAQRCVEEWNLSRPFDTIVQDICIQPAIVHAKTAFYLLTDCIYDPETQWYARKDRTWMLAAMVYKFWLYQTGFGCAFRNSEDAFHRTMEEGSIDHKLLLALKDHQMKIMESRKGMCDDGPPVGGPSLQVRVSEVEGSPVFPV